MLLSKITLTGNSKSGSSATRLGGGIYVNNGNVTLQYSRIANNPALSTKGGSGLYKDTASGTVTATNNWWGCSTGPGAAPCDTAVIAGGSSGSLTSTPHLQLRTSATPSALAVGGNAAVTASFTLNSAGTGVSANLDRLIGLPVTWSATGGSLSDQQTTIEASGSATATYQATSSGSGLVAAVVDNDATAAPRANVAAITANKTATSTVYGADQSFTLLQLGQTITFNALTDKTYGDAAFDLNATATSGLTVSFDSRTSATCSVSGATVSITGVGTCTIVARQDGSNVYGSAPPATQSFTVYKANQSIGSLIFTPLTLGVGGRYHG